MKIRSNSGNVVVMVCIMLVLVLIFILVVANQAARDASRQGNTARELQDVYEGIVGNPGAGTFGYLGDIGTNPSGLMDLTTSPGVSGWRGPYLKAPLAPVSGTMMVVDHYSAPLEYFLNVASVSTVQLAVISRGRDHGSTNGASNPNIASQFSSTLPNSGTYGTANPDNEIYPDFVTSLNALYHENAGLVTYDFRNFDQNTAAPANTLVNACPAMYSLNYTSVTRGSNDTTTLTYPGALYAQSLSAQLLQGVYDLDVLSITSSTSVWKERVVVTPGSSQSRTFNLPRIDSTVTQTYSLTVFNDGAGGGANTIEIWANGAQQGTDLNSNNSRSLAVKACTQIKFTNNGNSTTYETFAMPYGNHQRVIRPTGLTTLNLTVTNGGTNSDVIKVVYLGPPPSTNITGLVLGTVYKGHTRTFVVPNTTGTNFAVANRGARIQFRKRDDTLITTVNYTASTGVTQ